jgi:putative flippase GtrA
MFEKLLIFSKAQVSSGVGGVVDYLTMILFTEVFHIHYTISIAICGVVGAFVNFSINKSWAFRSKAHPYEFSVRKQLFRFILVVVNSIVLKMSGTYLLTTFLKIDYKISRIITDLIVSVIFNYMLQRYWVFKRGNSGLTEKYK